MPSKKHSVRFAEQAATVPTEDSYRDCPQSHDATGETINHPSVCAAAADDAIRAVKGVQK